jgi:hypothetical protein
LDTWAKLNWPWCRRRENGAGPMKRRWAGWRIAHLANIGPVPFFGMVLERAAGWRKLLPLAWGQSSRPPYRHVV